MRQDIASTTLAVIMAFASASAMAAEIGVFQPPNLENYAQEQEWGKDGDDDGLQETHFVRFMNPRGDKVVRMTTKGAVWAWIIKSHAYPLDSQDLGKNYVLRDSNCDGKYDERYSIDEHFELPECLK